MDPFVQQYYENKKKEAGWNRTDQYPICNYTQEDLEAIHSHFFELVKEVPMFMNSINRDADYKDNTEANKFVFVDRYMLDYGTLGDFGQVNDIAKNISFDQKADKLWWRGAPTSDNNTVFQFGPDRPSFMLENITTEETNDFHQSVWPRMHFLNEARKYPNDIDAKLSEDTTYTIGATKRVSLRNFAQGNWTDNYAKDPNLFYLLNDKIDERVGKGENHNYPQDTVKEMLENINRYYIDSKTNKIIDNDLQNLNLDRKNYSISTNKKPSLTFKNKTQMLFNMSQQILGQGEHCNCSRMGVCFMDVKEQVFPLIMSAMSGHDKVQNYTQEEVQKYIKDFEGQFLHKNEAEENKTRIEVMQNILENPKFENMLRLYFDTEYPPSVIDRMRSNEEMFKNKYLLSIDGHSAAWKRPNLIMGSNSVLFKTTSKQYQWYYDGMIPWVNYIPVRPDTQDMMQKLTWARENQGAVKQIIKNANKFSSKIFNFDNMYKFQVQTINGYYQAWNAKNDQTKN